MKSKFDGLILDIDGTIWNTTGVVAEAWNKAIDNSDFICKKVTADDLKKEFGKTMDVIASDLWPELSKDDQNVLISACCQQEHIAIQNNTENITYPGVIETIRLLHGKIKIYIVSNCQDGYIQLTMAKNDITDCIEDFECFGRTGLGKAENIMSIVERNKLKTPLYVGDTQGDAEACIKAEVPFVWASYGFGNVDKYYAKISEFGKIPEILGI